MWPIDDFNKDPNWNYEKYKLTTDPERAQHVANLVSDLKSVSAPVTIKLTNGASYTGPVTRHYTVRHSRTGHPDQVGAYFDIKTAGGKYRLDALDIETWNVTV